MSSSLEEQISVSDFFSSFQFRIIDGGNRGSWNQITLYIFFIYLPSNIEAMPGPFHNELAIFKAVGKIVEESVGPEMLTDSGVLAPGSSNGFLQGEFFNRCRRLHQILAPPLEILHFQAFMKTCKQSNDFSYSEVAVVLGNLQDDADR